MRDTIAAWLAVMLAWLRKNREYRLHFAAEVARTMLHPVRALRTRRMLVRSLCGIAMADDAREVTALVCEALADGDARDSAWVHLLTELLKATAVDDPPLPYAVDLLDHGKRAYPPG